MAVDPKEWHCDAIFVFAGSGMGCPPRDQGQAVGRFGRQGPGDGPGQISEYDGVNGMGVYMLVHFGANPESLEYGPSISRDELFASKRVRRSVHDAEEATTHALDIRRDDSLGRAIGTRSGTRTYWRGGRPSRRRTRAT